MDAKVAHANWAIRSRLAAPELLILSNGLPPPLSVLPDFCDSACAGDRLVLLAAVVVVFVVFEVLGGGVLLLVDVIDDCELDNVELCDRDGTVLEDFEVVLESVTSPVVTGFVDDKIIVLDPIAVGDAGIGTMVMLGLLPSPVVVVTTATLHSSCIALPILNSPMILVSSTSAVAHALATSALI